MHLERKMQLIFKNNLCIILLLYFCSSFSMCIESTTNRTIDETTLANAEELNVTAITTKMDEVSALTEEITSTLMPQSDTTFKDTTLHHELSTSIPTSPGSFKDTTRHHELTTSIPVPTSTKPQTNTSEILQKWLHFEKISKKFAKDAIKGLLPAVMEGTGDMNITASCRRDVLKFLVGLQNLKTWAFSMIDSSGKMVDGMLSGSMSNIGEYDQCLDTIATSDRRGKSQVLFRGQYCSLDLTPPIPPKKQYYKLNEIEEELREFAAGDNVINEAAKAAHYFHFLAMRIGICVPSGCQPSDIQQVVDAVAKETYWNVTVKRCEVKEENEFTPLIICVMTAMSFFGFLLAVGSLIDLYHKYAQKKITNLFLEVLVSFSLVANFKKLVNTENSKGKMSCLNGIRFLSISWVILGHTYLNTSYTLARNLKKGLLFQQDFFFQAVVNASVAVDSFFFIGGLLVCYVTVTVIRDTQKPFNVLLYILHRLIRLLPVYIMVILFIYLAPIIGSGPIFHDTVDGFLNACYKNWWTNVLFINNFVNTDQICLPQSWYVACDMQLYIAALIVILPILRWPWVGLTIASLGVLASVLGTAAMTYIYQYPPTMLFIHPDIEQRLAYWANAYFKPYSHAGPYCIGLITGYILAANPKLKLSRIVRIIGWTLAVGSNMSVLYGVYEWNLGRDPELIETLLYSGLHRVAWTFGVAWMVVNCFTGQGGVVNYILCWKVWIPLGRLTYTIYLIHPIVQIAALGNIRMTLQTAHFFAVWIFFGHLMITIGSAFAASMLVEAPFISLEKILLRFLTGKPRSTANGHEPIPSGSTTPKSENSDGDNNGTLRNGGVSHL